MVTFLYMTTIRKPVAKTYCFSSPTFGNRDAGLQQTQERQDLLVPNADANEEQRTRLKPPRDLFANKEQWPQRKATLDGTKSTTESADLTILVNDEVKRQPPPASSTRRKNLLILSQARSGSSLLGELFNNHPNIMYVFEPLHNLHYVSKRSNVSFKTETDSYGLLCNKILDSFFKCDFSNITNVLPLYSTTIFRLQSKALIGDYFCNSTTNTVTLFNFRKPTICVPLTNAPLSKACTSYKHTVLKVLSKRLPNKTLESFRGLFEHPNGGYDVKIVNLVRDPRAVVYSWMTLAWIKNHRNPGFRLNVRKICQPIEKNLRLGLSPPEWLQNRIKIIRYEDLVANTTEMTRQLYSFAGFAWSSDIEKWIEEHQKIQKKHQENNPYSTYRNGSVAVNKWRTAPETFIRIVEEVCGNIMDLMGYKKMEDVGQR